MTGNLAYGPLDARMTLAVVVLFFLLLAAYLRGESVQ